MHIRDSLTSIESEAGIKDPNEKNNARRQLQILQGKVRHEAEEDNDELRVEDKWDHTIFLSFDRPRHDVVPVELANGSTYYFQRHQLEEAIRNNMTPEELVLAA